ncbi:hypothetical protein [Janibacter terrae]|uniref:hypothetical protein n=1 Tax=Janibacter terrae TaxID=103817 RepID=UPI0031F8A153
MSSTQHDLYPAPAAPYPANDESLEARHMPGHYLAYGHHRRWCVEGDTAGTPADGDHGTRCESHPLAFHGTQDDNGKVYAGTVSLAASYRHGFYPAPDPRTGQNEHVRIELWRLVDEPNDVEECVSVNITPESARSLAAKLVALADKAEGLDFIASTHGGGGRR